MTEVGGLASHSGGGKWISKSLGSEASTVVRRDTEG